jgi:ATP synthase protein I
LSDDDDRDRLRRLEERIAAAKEAQDGPARKDEVQYSAAGLAWRMVTELVAGMGIGLLIGLGLDALFGTQPIMLVIFLGFGFAAGIRVMMRTAAEMQARTAQGGPGQAGAGQDGTGNAGTGQDGAGSTPDASGETGREGGDGTSGNGPGGTKGG